MLITATGAQALSHTGDWPTIQVEIEGKSYLRPAILQR